MVVGPMGAIILGFIAALTSHTMVTDVFEGILTICVPTALYYWAIRNVTKKVRYPIVFVMTFLINQLDAYIWSLWSCYFYQWIPTEMVLVTTAASLGPWSALNAVTVTAFCILADKYAPGFMKPTWATRWGL
jgi:small basic protein